MEIAFGYYQVIGDTFSNTFYKLLYIVLCRNNALYCCHNALFFVVIVLYFLWSLCTVLVIDLFICVYTEQNFLVWKANGSGFHRTRLWIFSGLAGWKLPLYPLRFLSMSYCIQPLVCARRSPIQLWTGPALLNFSDRADTDDLTPYFVSVVNKCLSSQCNAPCCQVHCSLFYSALLLSKYIQFHIKFINHGECSSRFPKSIFNQFS